VIRDSAGALPQRSIAKVKARALTEDLRRELVNAALVGPTLAHKPLRGSSNPNGL
jgi:hypothetical protein